VSHDAPTADPNVLLERRVLVVIGGGTVVERDLPMRGRLKVGRALECEVRIDDPALSRNHAVLVVDLRLSLVVESRTGRTRIDGRDVAPGTTVVLEPGQLVEIGESRLMVRRVREPASGARSGSRPMDATRRGIELAAKSELPILILGETGAGKEVAMEEIVASSRRSGAPLVRIDCAALPAHLLESELLGHEHGADAAVRGAPKPGLFEAASGGTAFLDEIANVPLEMQAKLLGVIESRAVTRLGGVKPSPVDVRVIAATNADVRARVAAGEFREDLYFRLAGMIVNVPPLRDRQDEIAELARTLLAAEAARESVAVPALSDGALALLVSYRWPGNVRELRNVIARAMHVAAKGTIEPEHIELVPPGVANADANAKPDVPTACSPATASGRGTC